MLEPSFRRLGLASCIAVVGALDPVPCFGVDRPAPLGRLVDVGGYRLHIHVLGTGHPSVVLIAGSGDLSVDWALVQPAVAEFTRVASYDRAGLAWSDSGPAPRTIRQNVLELHTLLHKAGLTPPFVLVGHSYGGLIARLFSKAYRPEVQGMVLVDATHEEAILFLNGRAVRLRELATRKAIPPPTDHLTEPPKVPSRQELEDQWRQFGAPRIEDPFSKLPREAQAARLWALSRPEYYAAESDPYMAEEMQELHMLHDSQKQALGDMPLIVVTAGIKDYPSGANVTPEELRRSHEQYQVDLVGLSRNGQRRVASSARHHVQLDSPEIVIQAIHDVVRAVRSRKP